MYPKTLFLLVLTLSMLPQNQADTKKMAADVDQSLVKIIMMNAQGQGNSIGTGFFVGKGELIATASHVYLDAAKAIVDSNGGALFAAKMLRSGAKFSTPIELAKADYPDDLALLSFDSEAIKKQAPGFQIQALTLEDQKPQTGQDVAFMGYFGSDDFPLLSRTVISGFTGAPEHLVLDLPANPGQSGSPVISLDSGKVIGVLASFVPVTLFPGTSPTHSGLSRSVEAEHLKRLIESAEVR